MCATLRRMSADTSRSLRRIPIPVALLIGANALTQFAIQAWMAYGFADKVWKLRHPLPYAAPVALDVFAVTMMVLTYHLRNAPWRTRTYAWFWLGVAIASQVGVSEGFADHERWSAWGRAASVGPAVFLAASLHALIIVARRREHGDAPAARQRVTLAARWRAWYGPKAVAEKLADALDTVPARSSQLAAAHAIAARTALVKNAKPVQPEPARQPEPPAAPAPAPVKAASRPSGPRAPRQAGRRTNPHRADVIKRCLDAVPPEDAATVAAGLGVNPRTAQFWVKQERERRAAASRSATSAAPAGASGPREISRGGGGPFSDAPDPTSHSVSDLATD